MRTYYHYLLSYCVRFHLFFNKYTLRASALQLHLNNLFYYIYRFTQDYYNCSAFHINVNIAIWLHQNCIFRLRIYFIIRLERSVFIKCKIDFFMENFCRNKTHSEDKPKSDQRMLLQYSQFEFFSFSGLSSRHKYKRFLVYFSIQIYDFSSLILCL